MVSTGETQRTRTQQDSLDNHVDVRDMDTLPGIPIQAAGSLTQDEIDTPTPVPMAPPAAHPEPVQRGGSKALWAVVALSLIISLLSLALNVALIYQLMSVRQKAVQGVEKALAALEGFASEGFQYEYQFDRTIPFEGDIPFRQDIVFPFEGTIPFNTTVKVPIDIGVIQTEIEVPVDTSVYVNTSIPISIDESFHVETEIPVSMTIPINIQPDDPAIQGFIDSLREYLTDLVESF